ncbi:putative B6 ABC transporter permease subunit 2 [Pseudohoeflea coraliihabitans]|uniref:ABC transporter permease n=1 Tax=Pseudohoeflea coraliihabitans TaxID=2860393 RepID=A0ABS6WT96_9HYPH|nr:ABC transporter permease [Pseudohoeflea sp. DP4N28-3]MBW3098280.1 ABC transporter permease [Pseudohoeflea sp. DP4N28-3]
MSAQDISTRPSTTEAAPEGEAGQPATPAARGVGKRLAMTVGPVLVALALAGLLLMALGVNPLTYYTYVIERGLLSPSGVQQTLTRMGPLLFLAAGLIVSFRAGIWNLGGDGQFLLGAVAAAASAPLLAMIMPAGFAVAIAFVIAIVVAMLWSLVPALLKGYQGVNEIITTLMMTFLGASLANVLVKLIFLDPGTTVPQTRTLPVADRLPRLFDTTISSGLLFGLAAIIAVHLMMVKTSFGLKLRIVGANPRAAIHAGLSVPKLTVAVFALSAGLCGIAGALDVLGVQGNVRADWNPGYALTVIPMVFLARFNGYASIAFVGLLSVLSIGGESAARRLGVPNDFTLLLVAIVLIVLAIAEYIDHRLSKAAKV